MPAPLKVVAFNQLRAAGLGQSSQALIVQSHCKSVLVQPQIDLSRHPNLKIYSDGVNQALARAKENSNEYLNRVLPGMIGTVSDMEQYFVIQSAIAGAFTPSANVSDTLKKLKVAQERVTTYKANTSSNLSKLQTLREALSNDAGNFARVVENMNTAVNGNNGALSELNKSIDSIDGKIKGSIAGIVLGGLAVIGGVFVFLVGAVGSFVTAGTSAPLAVLGVGVVATGVGALVGSSIALSNLLKAKTDLIQLGANLREEVKLATSLHSTYKTLTATAVDAVQATQEMANAWSLTGDNLGGLIKNLEAGADVHTDSGMVEFYGVLAAGDVTSIKADIATIKAQLTGVQQNQSSGATPSEMILQHLGRAA